MDEPAGTALAVLAAALAAWPSPAAAVGRRVRRVTGSRSPRRELGAGRRSAFLPPAIRRWLLAVAAGTAVAVLLGGAWGPVLGAASAAGVEWVLRRGSDPPDEDGPLVRALPLACDLLAVCLEAGMPPAAAVVAVAEAAADPLAEHLGRVGGLYRLGAEPLRAWTGVPPAMAPLARAFVRAGGSGSAVVPALRSLAADLRASSGARTEAAVRRAGVWVLAPLGACFLPAFLCLGVVPLVLGIARDVFR